MARPPLLEKFYQSEPLTVSLICLLALGLRLFNLDATSLWIDEIYSLMVTNTHLYPTQLHPAIHSANEFYQHFLSWQPMNVDRLLALLKINVHMPLYYLLLNPWLDWFGNNAVGLRSFSAVWSALLILPVFGLGKALGGRQAGYLCALVTALLPFQIYYGQEGRMYALSLFWAGWAGLAFWQILFGKRPALWGWLYALAVSGGMLSHYMFVFFLGFQALFALMFGWRTQQWKRLMGALPAVVALGAIALWWAPVYQLQQQGVNEEYHFAKGLVGWTRYLSVPFWQPLVVVAGDNRLSRLIYIPITLLLLVLAYRSHKAEKARFSFSASGYLLSWLWIPLLLQIAYDFWKHTHIAIIDRYAMLISPAMGLIVGLALARLWITPRHANTTPPTNRGRFLAMTLLGGMALVALASVASPSPFRDEHNKDDHIREKMGYFLSQAKPADLIFVNGPLGAPNLAAFYLQPTRPQQPMVYWISRYQGQPVPLPAPELFKPYQRVWLFRHRANNERGLQTAKDYLKSMYPHQVQTHDWFIFSKQTNL
ncbi:glycosyltransferase family 39 protein [Vampirovibrio chlorellavorus]|uniref:glycosyltransferase family 39 protein n=1 Tax=Vampirovibrio chlorellavorus TaxID=758823 RepID=UPI0026EE164B|nr:glycosyltransferase family 39 protein [Vampirovibrio chlorellavorus]